MLISHREHGGTELKRDDLPKAFYRRDVLENFILRDDRNLKVFCSRSDYFIMKLGDLFQSDHFLKNLVIQGNQNKILTGADLFEQIFEIEFNSFFVKNAE